MVDHLLQFSPKHCEVIKELRVREVVRLGVERAGSFGLTNRGPVRLFIELMFMFGSEFATDPQHAWAAPSLEETMPGDQMYRAELLYSAAQKYLEDVSGPGHRYAVAALRRTRIEISVGDPLQFDVPPEQFGSCMLSVLRRVYPEKVDYLKDRGLDSVLDLGLELATQHRIKQARGRALFVFLVFVLGRGVANDPLYPWIRSALVDPGIVDPEARAARMESRAAVYLDHVIEYVRDV